MPGHKAGPLRLRFRFWGRVQGVGFRWRAAGAARQLGLSGWVQNQPDGSVLLEAQGREEEIDRMILAIEASPYIRIENMEVEKLEPLERAYGFETRD